MSEDKKNSSGSSSSSDPLFDALKSGNVVKPGDAPKKVDRTELPEPVRPKPVATGPKKESGFKHFMKEKLTKREFIIGSIIFVIILGGLIAFGITHRAGGPLIGKKPEPPAPTVYYSPLTGVKVAQFQTKLPVTAVMIENSTFARPQSGLRQAGVVFEAIAEAGITRFMALYQEAHPKNLGPIRSARPYYALWALGFDAGYAHVGGSPEALSNIQTWHVKDMNEFAYGSYYHRISSREAPHNMYTSMASLNAIEKKNGWNTSHFTGFARKDPSPAKTPKASTISFSISSADYNVLYKYDKTSNSYLRRMGGVPHTDAATGKQLHPTVVIGMVMPYGTESDGYHSTYNVIGKGKVYVFQDGKVTIGAWHKTTRRGSLSFTDGGKPIKLNRGQTWITALSSSGNVSYKP